jgi:hypothetical protein
VHTVALKGEQKTSRQIPDQKNADLRLFFVVIVRAPQRVPRARSKRPFLRQPAAALVFGCHHETARPLEQFFLARGKRIDPKCPRDRSGGKTDVNVDVSLSEIPGERADDPSGSDPGETNEGAPLGVMVPSGGRGDNETGKATATL